MNIILFLFIATFFSLTLGEFGQYPFGNTTFSISMLDVLLTLGLSALLIWNIAIKKNLKLPRNFIFLMVFWAVSILGLFLSLDLSGWLYLLRFIIYSSTFYLTYHLVKSGIFALHEYLTLLKVTSVVLGILGITQLIIHPKMGTLANYGYDPHIFRLFSTFLDPNLLGTFLNFGFILVIYELISKQFTNLNLYVKENKWSLFSATILGISIILTFSRSAYLMLVISSFIILAMKNLKVLGGFAVLVLILYLIFPAFNSRISGAFDIDASANERFSSWDKGITIFQNNPIWGIGFNNIRSYSQQQDLIKIFSSDGGNSGAGIDSSLIFILATTGIIGFLTYILFLIKIITDLVSSATYNTKFFYNLQFQPVKLMKMIYKLPGLGKWYNEDTSIHSALKNNYLSLPLLSITAGLIAGSFFINSMFFSPIMFLWFSMLGVFYGSESDS